jgi:hypothetical protein
MITVRGRFNLYLLLALVATIACGCRTHKNDKSKQLATLRVHMQTGAGGISPAKKISIYRASPVDMSVEQEPFLTEAHVASAQVVNALGGFEIQIQLNRQGTWLLQEYSASNSGQRYAIFSQFGEKGKESRWLAAPQFTRLINDGIIQFTPDATREEADEIVLGLNNLAKKNESNDKW